MNDSSSEVFTADNGATVEVGTFSFQGRPFRALGAVIDEAKGSIVAYVSDAKGGGYNLTTWNGVVIAPLRLTGKWKNRNVFGGWPVEMFAWSAKVGGRTYSGRNSGSAMMIRMRATKETKAA